MLAMLLLSQSPIVGTQSNFTVSLYVLCSENAGKAPNSGSYVLSCVCGRVFPIQSFSTCEPLDQTSTVSALTTSSAGNIEKCQREMLTLCDIAFTAAYSNLILNLLAYCIPTFPVSVLAVLHWINWPCNLGVLMWPTNLFCSFGIVCVEANIAFQAFSTWHLLHMILPAPGHHAVDVQ